MKTIPVFLFLGILLFPCVVFTLGAFLGSTLGFVQLLISLPRVQALEFIEELTVPIWLIYTLAFIVTVRILHLSWKACTKVDTSDLFSRN